MFFESDRSQNRYLYCEKVVNMCFNTHIQSSYEVLYVINGEISCIINGNKYKIKQGQAAFILPNTPHSIELSYCENITLIFSSDYVGSFNRRINGCELSHPVFTPSSPSMLDGLDKKDYITQKGVLYYICGEALEQCKPIETKSTDRNLLQNIMLFIQQNYASDITLKQMASHIGYNPCYVSDYINKNFRENFRSIVNGYRIDRAVEMLENSDASITEISEKCGFTNLRSFNRAFKQHLNTCPSDFRKSKETP